ncbi:MAG: type II toxin-antitoxin system RelB/DinJ family antitoxin [bacterium]|nr:type II toxin-antitoxin system RelB/DinJ family antitoxin [bacterium]
MQTQLTIRIENNLKKEAQAVAENFGLPLSALIKAFLANVVQTKKITLQEHNDDYLDVIIMSACRDKKIASRLEKLASLAIKKYANAL